MKKQIKIQNEEIDYVLRTNKRAKRMRLVIYKDGSLVVTKPYRLPNIFVNSFLRNKANWVLSKIEHFKRFKRIKIVKNDKVHYLKRKEEARRFIENEVREINQYYKFDYKRISIRNQATRWGSCSQNGNLSFNYRLLFLPQKIAEYVIVHEICHLKEMNHSAGFWKLVSQRVPDYKNIKSQLKKNL